MHLPNAIARVCVVAVFTAIVPTGCAPSTGGPNSREEIAIAQVGQLFHIYQKSQKPPPKSIKDIETMRGNLPAAIASIKSKDVLVYWGAGISDDSSAASTVLAYHKDVPEKGGEVLMQNGKPRKMTAAEFQAAPKPADGKLDDAKP
jgi:hypothetical protein